MLQLGITSSSLEPCLNLMGTESANAPLPFLHVLNGEGGTSDLAYTFTAFLRYIFKVISEVETSVLSMLVKYTPDLGRFRLQVKANVCDFLANIFSDGWRMRLIAGEKSSDRLRARLSRLSVETSVMWSSETFYFKKNSTAARAFLHDVTPHLKELLLSLGWPTLLW